MDSLKACPNPGCKQMNAPAANFCRMCGCRMSGYLSPRSAEPTHPEAWKTSDSILFVFLSGCVLLFCFVVFSLIRCN